MWFRIQVCRYCEKVLIKALQKIDGEDNDEVCKVEELRMHLNFEVHPFKI